jgi:hypothetical protein
MNGLLVVEQAWIQETNAVGNHWYSEGWTDCVLSSIPIRLIIASLGISISITFKLCLVVW